MSPDPNRPRRLIASWRLVIALVALAVGVTTLAHAEQAGAQDAPGYATARVGEIVLGFLRGMTAEPDACRVDGVLADQSIYLAACSTGKFKLPFAAARPVDGRRAPSLPPPPAADPAAISGNAAVQAELATLTAPLSRCFEGQRVRVASGEAGRVASVLAAEELGPPRTGSRCEVVVDFTARYTVAQATELKGTKADATSLGAVPRLKAGRYTCKAAIGEWVKVRITSTTRYADAKGKTGTYRQSGALVTFTSGPLKPVFGVVKRSGSFSILRDTTSELFCEPGWAP